MFDFTKEVVINSADQLVLDKNGYTLVDGEWKAPDTAPSNFFIHGGGKYFKGNVVGNKYYKTASQPGNPFELSFAPVVATEGDVQYCIELGLDRGDARGDWGSALYYFKKPLLITVSHSATAEDIAKAFTKVGSGYGMISAEVTEVDGNKVVVIKGGDDKIKVRGVKVLNIVGDNVTELPFDLKAAYTENKVEFGTANYLLHNLRLPTYENYRFTSPAAVEMPVAGTNYTQYTFLYCVERPGLGGLSVAGQTNHSTTTHVFYVADGLKDLFEGLIKRVAANEVEVTPADNKEKDMTVDIFDDSKHNAVGNIPEVAEDNA